jgi:hypothetical protein
MPKDIFDLSPVDQYFAYEEECKEENNKKSGVNSVYSDIQQIVMQESISNAPCWVWPTWATHINASTATSNNGGYVTTTIPIQNGTTTTGTYTTTHTYSNSRWIRYVDPGHDTLTNNTGARQ